MIKLIPVTAALLVPLVSLTAFSYGADVSGNLSVNVVPPEATPRLRGRPHIANRTLVADNGSILRGVHIHPDPGAGGLFSQWYGSLSWWQNLPNIGHFNVVRAPSRPDAISLADIESAYDTMIPLAAQASMYVIVGNAYGAGSQSTCPTAAQLQSFWSTIATPITRMSFMSFSTRPTSVLAAAIGLTWRTRYTARSAVSLRTRRS